MTTTVEITTVTTTTSTEVVDLTNTDAADAFARFNELKASLKELEAEKAEVEKHLRELLGNAEVATVDGHKLFGLGHSKNSSFDRELMAKAFPEALETCLKSKPYTFLKAL